MVKKYSNTTRDFFKDGLEKFKSNINSSNSLDLSINSFREWFSLEDFDGYKLDHVYWVAEPYEFVRIHYSEPRDEYLYEIVTPEFSEEIKNLATRVDDFVSISINKLSDPDYAKIYDVLYSINKEFQLNIQLDVQLIQLTYEYIVDNSLYGKLQPLLNDSYVQDISINKPQNTVIYHSEAEAMTTTINFTKSELKSYIISIKDTLGKSQHKTEYGEITDKNKQYRIHYSLGDDYTITIEKQEMQHKNPISLIQNDFMETIDAAYIWTLVCNRNSILIYGGTASGKQELLNTITYFIPPSRKTALLQDSKVLEPLHENTVETIIGALDSTEIKETLNDMLRLVPEAFVYEKVRTDIVVELFNLIQTDRSLYTTLHAGSVESVFTRLHNPPINMDIDKLIQIDAMLECERTENCPKLSKIYEICGYSTEHDYDLGLDIDIRELTEMPGSKVQDEDVQRKNELLSYLVENDISDDRQVYNILSQFVVDDPSDIKSWIEDNFNVLITNGD